MVDSSAWTKLHARSIAVDNPQIQESSYQSSRHSTVTPLRLVGRRRKPVAKQGMRGKCQSLGKAGPDKRELTKADSSISRCDNGFLNQPLTAKSLIERTCNSLSPIYERPKVSSTRRYSRWDSNPMPTRATVTTTSSLVKETLPWPSLSEEKPRPYDESPRRPRRYFAEIEEFIDSALALDINCPDSKKHVDKFS